MQIILGQGLNIYSQLNKARLVIHECTPKSSTSITQCANMASPYLAHRSENEQVYLLPRNSNAFTASKLFANSPGLFNTLLQTRRRVPRSSIHDTKIELHSSSNKLSIYRVQTNGAKSEVDYFPFPPMAHSPFSTASHSSRASNANYQVTPSKCIARTTPHSIKY